MPVARPLQLGPLLALDLDQFDRLYFPRRGWSVQAEAFRSPRRGYGRYTLDLRGALPLREWVLGTRLYASGSMTDGGTLPLDDVAALGGFLNLSAYATGQLLGDEVIYGHLRTERIIGRLPLGLRGDMRFGIALEAGRVGLPYTLQKREGTLRGAALYLGGETPLGSVYVGIGRASGGAVNAYLFIGTP